MEGQRTVRILNATRGTAVAERAGVADTFWSSFMGLMGRPPLPKGDALLITPSSSIHTHFMRFPIDVLYVDKADVIVGVDRAVKPWRFGRFYKRVHYVIEMTAGGAAGCEVGDQLSLTS